MIVIGSDPHKQSFAFAAAVAGTGEQLGCETVEATAAGFDRVLAWARRLDAERVWAIEDCRHVWGRLERFLVARGERIVRVPPKLMAGARRGGRRPGKSDPIDAIAVARAALREGIRTLPAAHLDEHALEIRLLLDHHDDLVGARTRDQARLRWHLHDLECPVDIPSGGLDRDVWLDRLGRWLARQQRTARVRIARRLVVQIRAQTREIRQLERELGALVAVNAAGHDRQTAQYLARRQAEGKTRMEALRCLKRHLARCVWHLLTQPTPTASALDSALALT
jgi:transposase